MNIAILGAPATGKRWLAQALAACRPNLHINATPGTGHTAERTLLMGLDLAPPSPQQSAADTALRERLRAQGIPYGVVYGRGEQRLRNALRLLEPEAEQKRNWNWVCEKCSDPECEHKLFTGLTRSTAAEPPGP